MKNFYTVDALANELGVTTRTIRNYLQSGQLSGNKVGGHWRFSREDVQAFIGSGNQAFPKAHQVILDFVDDSIQEINQDRTMIVFHLSVASFAAVNELKDTILEEYNTVYQGKGRELYYQLAASDIARITLIGPANYVLNFGSWISKQIKLYKKKN